MRFLVPSYGRCGRSHTLDLLRGIGEPVTVSTQTEDDYAAYRREYPWADVIYREARNVAGNTNTLLLTIDGPAILMDDDIRGVNILRGGGALHRARADELREYADSLIEAVETLRGAAIVTSYAVDNAMFQRSAYEADGRFSRNKLSSMWMCAVSPRAGLMDESYDAKEDYEIQLRNVMDGRNVYRCNICSPITDYRTKRNVGGRGFTYDSAQDREAFKRIRREYGPIVTTSRKGHKIRLRKGL